MDSLICRISKLTCMTEAAIINTSQKISWDVNEEDGFANLSHFKVDLFDGSSHHQYVTKEKELDVKKLNHSTYYDVVIEGITKEKVDENQKSIEKTNFSTDKMGEFRVTMETECNDVTVQWVYESSGTDDVIMGVEAHDVIMHGPFDKDPSEELLTNKWKVLEKIYASQTSSFDVNTKTFNEVTMNKWYYVR